MHEKFMHELGSLLMHIPTYLDVMGYYNHGLHLFMEIFYRYPCLGYNFAEQETCVLHIFYVLGNFQNTNEARLFLESLFFPGQQLEMKKHTSGQPGHKQY
jgi:hypothetical protein